MHLNPESHHLLKHASHILLSKIYWKLVSLILIYFVLHIPLQIMFVEEPSCFWYYWQEMMSGQLCCSATFTGR